MIPFARAVQMGAAQKFVSPGLSQIGADCWESPEGSIRVRYPSPSVVVYRFIGRMTPDFVPKIRAAADAALKPGRHVSLFFDTEGMSGYHPAFRSKMTSWHEELRDQTRSAGVLVRSRVIQMAISVASLVTGGKMTSYSTRDSFEAAIQQATQKASQERWSQAPGA